MTLTLRALLAVALLVGLYLLAALVVGSISLGVYELVAHGAPGVVVAKVGAVGAVAVVGILRGLWERRDKEDVPLPGTALAEHLQPRVWAEAREVAALARTRGPDEIRVVADVDAAVSEDATWLGLRRGTRRLYLGMPLLMGLDHQQLRAVLAHEFGHYSGRHTALGTVTHRGQEAIGRVLQRLDDQSWAAKLFGLYGRLYLATSRGVSRRQELEADQLAAELVGARTIATALQLIPRIEMAWAHFLGEYVAPGAQLGARSDDLFESFAAFCADRPTQHRLHARVAEARFFEAARSQAASRYDTHPPLSVRVAALTAYAARSPREEPAGGGPALGLLHDSRSVMTALADATFEESLAGFPLAEVVPMAALVATSDSASRLHQALAHAGRPPTLAAALDAVQDPGATDLLRPWAPLADPESLRLEVAMHTADLVAQRLVDDDRARFVLTWPFARTLVAPDGARLDPWTAAFVAVDDPRRGTALRDWVAAHGVRLHETAGEQAAIAPPTPGHPEWPQAAVGTPVELVAIATPVSGRGVKTVYVTTHGIALEVLGFWPSVRVFGAAFGRSHARAMRDRALRREPEEVILDHHTTWAPWASLWGVEWKPKAMGRGVLRLRLGDGSGRKVTFSVETVQEGDVIGAIHFFLGDRFRTR